MKKTITFILILILILGAISIPVLQLQKSPNLMKKFTQGEVDEEIKLLGDKGSIESNKTTVSPGETFDVYVTLTTTSVGWDVQFTNQSEELISNSVTIPTIEENDESVVGNKHKIYLIQIGVLSQWIDYEADTVIAKRQYTVSETAPIGSEITIDVMADIVLKTLDNFDVEEKSIQLEVVEPDIRADVVIKYVEKDNNENVIETIIEEDLQVGTTYNYTVPEYFTKESVLWKTEGFGNKTHTVAEGDNTILIEYEQVQANIETVTVKYVEKDNNENVLYTQEVEKEVGTTYNYTVPENYTKNNLLWRTEDFGNKNYTVVEADNIIIVEYEKVLENVIIKYVERNNITNVLNTITEEDLQVGTVHSYTVPQDYIKTNLLWRTTNYGVNKTYTVIEGTNEILIEYDKVLEDVVIKYVEKNNNSNILNTIIEEDLQVGDTYNYTVLEDYTKNGLLWRTAEHGDKIHEVIEGENEILVEYEKVISDVVIKYVEKDDNENVIETIIEEDLQVGYTYNYTITEYYTKDSLFWKTTEYGEKTHEVIEGINEIIIEYEQIDEENMTTVIVKYVEKDNEENVLYMTEVLREIGIVYNYTVPEDYIKNGLLWRTEDFGDKTNLIIDGENVILIEYEMVLSNVVIKYVEKDNNENVIEILVEEDLQVGTEYNYTIPENYTKNGLLWRTTEYGDKIYEIEEGTNEILVEYEKVLSDIVIKYVEKDNNENVIEILIEEDLQVGAEYNYIVPEEYISSGMLWKTEDYGDKTHEVIEGLNEIIIEYEKAITNVTILYVEKDNNSNVLNTIDVGLKQIGTTYTYIVPEYYAQNEIVWKTTEHGTKTYTIVKGLNEIIVEYEQTDDEVANVTVLYVDKDNHNNILYTVNAGLKLVGTTYEYTVPVICPDNENWKLADIENIDRSHEVILGDNEILVEYELAEVDVVIKHQNADGTEAAPTKTVKQNAGTKYIANKADITGKCVSKVYVNQTERTDLKYPINNCEITVVHEENEIIFVYEDDTNGNNIPDKIEFDLKLNMYVDKMILTEGGKTQTIPVGQAAPNMAKVEINSSKVNSLTLKIVYKLVVTNEGLIDGSAAELINYMPTGLKFVSADNPDWHEVGNGILATDALKDKILKPGETAQIELVLQWINLGSNMGVKTNKAEISKTYNEDGIPDIKTILDDKYVGIVEADIIVGIKTGETVVILSALTIAVLCILGTGIVCIKKFVL